MGRQGCIVKTFGAEVSFKGKLIAFAQGVTQNSVSRGASVHQAPCSRLSFDFGSSKSTLPLPFTHPLRQCSEGGSSATNTQSGQTSHIQSTNQAHALNVFAAQKHQTLSAIDGEFCQQRSRASTIHRSNSVWKEVLLPLSCYHYLHHLRIRLTLSIS